MAKRRNRNKRASGSGKPTSKKRSSGSQPTLANGSKLASGSQPKIAHEPSRASGSQPTLAEGSRPIGARRMQLPKVAEIVALPSSGFTELEEAFFAAGDTLAERVAAKIARQQEDEEPAPARPSFWRRLFTRTPATA